MKDLKYLLKRMSQSEIARSIEMERSNISMWKTNGKVSQMGAIKLRILANKIKRGKNVPKRRTVLL